MPSEETFEYATWTENVALRCIYSEYYFAMVTGHKGEFWPIVQNALGESVCVLWSHLFGNRSDDLHYSKFFSREDIASLGESYSPEKVKARLLSRICMNQNEYREFWQQVKNCRDQYVAHKEVSVSGLIFPHVDKCRIMMEEVRVILEELFRLWQKSEPHDAELEKWVDYYAWNQNESLSKKSSKAFSLGIEHLAEIMADNAAQTDAAEPRGWP